MHQVMGMPCHTSCISICIVVSGCLADLDHLRLCLMSLCRVWCEWILGADREGDFTWTGHRDGPGYMLWILQSLRADVQVSLNNLSVQMTTSWKEFHFENDTKRTLQNCSAYRTISEPFHILLGFRPILKWIQFIFSHQSTHTTPLWSVVLIH